MSELTMTRLTFLGTSTANPGAGEDTACFIINGTLLIDCGFNAALNMQPYGYHLRQCLGLFVAAVACGVAVMVLAIIPVFGALVGFLAFPVGGIAFIAPWIMGLIAAANGQQKPMPVVGEYFQKVFGNAFD